MLNIIINLLLINAIVCLVELSGWWQNLDAWVNSIWRFRHLGHIFMCSLCQCFWLSILFCLVTGNLSILTIAISLANAHLTKVVTPLWTTVENYLLKLIEILNKPLM